MLSCFSLVQLSVTAWTVTWQAALSMGFSRQEYWGGVPHPAPGKGSSCSLKTHKHPATLMRVAEMFKSKSTEVPLSTVLVYMALVTWGHPRSTTVWKYEMENSRNKLFINLKLQDVPSCMINSHTALLCPTGSEVIVSPLGPPALLSV